MEKGFSTHKGGVFLLAPLLKLHLLTEQIRILNIKKREGISPISSALCLIHTAIFGKRSLNAAGKISDLGLICASGLSQFPEDNHFHTHLQTPSIRSIRKAMIWGSKVLFQLGLIRGQVVNLDSHFAGYFGESLIGKEKHPTRNISLPGIRFYYAQDSLEKEPLYLEPHYAGGKPVDRALPLVDAAVKAVDKKDIRFIFDRWFSVGELLEFLDKYYQVEFVTLLRLHRKRVKEMQKVSKDTFRRLNESQRIAVTTTNIRNYTGEVKLIVLEEEDGDPPLRGYLTNVKEDIEPRLIWEYSKRWRIENFFKENLFLHLDHLPGIDLVKISLLLYYKKIAYHAVSAFKKSLPDEHKNKHIQTIVEDFLEAEAFVKKRGDRIRVSFMGHRYEDILQPIFSKINRKLEEKRIKPFYPWLNHHKIEFKFK